MADYIVKATAAEGKIRAFACDTRQICEDAKNAHNTSPVVTAALGRLLSAAAMMGSMNKGDRDLLTIKIEGSGPMKAVLVTADSHGNVKGYPFVSDVRIPANKNGKLDVAEAIGVGILTIISDIGLKEPYVGRVELVSGEIAEDLTYYYATSQQTPSSVGLGVLLNKDNTINCAGGFIIQLMPDCTEDIIEKLEKNLSKVSSVTDFLSSNKTPEDILHIILEGLSPSINDKIDCRFKCDCNKNKVEKALISVGKKEIEDMISDNKDIEVNCHFCNSSYTFTVDELGEILKRS